MLLSDRDLKAELAAGGLGLDPYDEQLVQPSSIDVRLDRYFRVFANHRYTHIDPAIAQDDLTEMVEPDGEEPFVLHPGEFVLGSTLEVITLGDHLASRLEGKALALFTEVPTPQGWRTMGDLQVGDEVFDADGAPTRVVAATEVLDRRPCYSVELSDGSRFVADASHQWVTRTKAERSRGLPARARTTQEMACTLRAGREWNHHVPLAGAAQYPEVDLEHDPASLGALLTCPPGALPTVPGPVGTAPATPSSAPGALPTVPGPVGTAPATPSDDVWAAARRAATGSVAQREALLDGVLAAAGDVDRSGRHGLVVECERLVELVVEVAASLGLRPVAGKAQGRRRGVEAPLHEVRWAPAEQPARRGLRLPGSRAPRARAVVAVRPTASVPVRCIEVAAESGTFLVGRTYVPTHNSSLGRLGLLTHSTAGFIDPGFSGHVTLELSNVANLPIKLYPGMKIGQVCVFRLTSPAENPYGSAVYGSRYQGQRGPTPSRSHLRFSRASTLPPG